MEEGNVVKDGHRRRGRRGRGTSRMWGVEEGADERDIEEGGSGLWKKETSRKEDMEKGGIEERRKVNGTSRKREVE